MIVLIAQYLTKPEETDAILADLRRMAEQVEQHEPGCLLYRVHQAWDHPNQLLLYEAYRDQDSLDAHAETPYFQEIVLGRVVPKLLERKRSLWHALP
ncbi:MAG: antibiotic biosynthesis monooxygenase [Firmicutes bacterium]|nr:antibiotic biosynthesis monooxygenase [Bacillota bacterium]